MKKINTNAFLFDGKGKFSIKKTDTKVKDYYENKEDYEVSLSEMQKKMDDLQDKMFAHNRYGLLVVFQAPDAAGKDGTLKAVFSGVNPQGMRFYSFKKPTDTELEHDFLWRTNMQLPERGTITVFNRSYYEEVLVVKVHPEILLNSQKHQTLSGVSRTDDVSCGTLEPCNSGKALMQYTRRNTTSSGRLGIDGRYS